MIYFCLGELAPNNRTLACSGEVLISMPVLFLRCAFGKCCEVFLRGSVFVENLRCSSGRNSFEAGVITSCSPYQPKLILSYNLLLCNNHCIDFIQEFSFVFSREHFKHELMSDVCQT